MGPKYRVPRRGPQHHFSRVKLQMNLVDFSVTLKATLIFYLVRRPGISPHRKNFGSSKQRTTTTI
jgi:hypothetical protein